MLLPALSQARDAARGILCLSNQKQTGLGIMAFCNDHENIYPVAVIGGNLDGFGRWIQAQYKIWGKLQGYMNNPDIAVCPTYKPFKYTGDWYTYGFNAQDTYYNAYGASNAFVKTPVPPGHGSGTAEYVYFMKISKPSEFPILFDSIRWDYTQQDALIGPNSTSASGAGLTHLRHSKAANIWYPDGHASATTQGTLGDLHVTSFTYHK
jgi:prepilin-type processing-associated H-X9-DG protein